MNRKKAIQNRWLSKQPNYRLYAGIERFNITTTTAGGGAAAASATHCCCLRCIGILLRTRRLFALFLLLFLVYRSVNIHTRAPVLRTDMRKAFVIQQPVNFNKHQESSPPIPYAY